MLKDDWFWVAYLQLVRDNASTSVCPLSNVSNLSMIRGTVPDDLKSAIVVPLLQKRLEIIAQFNFKISSERRSFGSKEDIKETKIADSVSLSLFMCSNVMEQYCPRPLAPEYYPLSIISKVFEKVVYEQTEN